MQGRHITVLHIIKFFTKIYRRLPRLGVYYLRISYINTNNLQIQSRQLLQETILHVTRLYQTFQREISHLTNTYRLGTICDLLNGFQKLVYLDTSSH